MIKLKNGWQIDSDGYCFILQQVATSKNGKEYIKSQTYHSTLCGAIKRAMNAEQLQVVQEQDLTLKDAVQALEGLHAEFQAMLAGVEESEKL